MLHVLYAYAEGWSIAFPISMPFAESTSNALKRNYKVIYINLVFSVITYMLKIL
jgi:hypothetical protein